MDELDIGEVMRRSGLPAMRDALRHAAACPAPTHMECPTFRRLLQAAAAGAARAPRPRRPPSPQRRG